MKKQNNKTGSAFISNQKSLDDAKNQTIKNEAGANSGNGTNRTKSRDNKTDVSQKKTGGGKLSAKGD